MTKAHSDPPQNLSPSTGADDLELAAAEFRPRSSLSPGLAAVGGLAVGAVAAALIGLFVLGDKQPRPTPAASASAASATPVPSTSASAAPPTLTPLARAALGEKEALDALQKRAADTRTVEETVTIARGLVASKREAIGELKRKIQLVPKFGRERTTYVEVRDHARDGTVAVDVLEALATLPGEVGPDLLYKLWRDRGNRSQETRELARELLYSREVRQHASAALRVVLDLEGAETCEAAQKALEDAKTSGDKRSLVHMVRFHQKRGCGDNKLVDCWPCLREGDLLKDAVKEARGRAAP